MSSQNKNNETQSNESQANNWLVDIIHHYINQAPFYVFVLSVCLGVALIISGGVLLYHGVLENKNWIDVTNFHLIFWGMAGVGLLLVLIPLYFRTNIKKAEIQKEASIKKAEIQEEASIKKAEIQEGVNIQKIDIQTAKTWLINESNTIKEYKKHAILLFFIYTFNNEFTVSEIRTLFTETDIGISTQFTDLKTKGGYGIPAKYKPAIEHERGWTVSITDTGRQYLEDEWILQDTSE